MKIKNIINNLSANFELRSFFSSSISFLTTIIFLAYNFIIGLIYHSVWNFSISFYYLLLVVLRGLIIFNEKKWRDIEDTRRNSNRIHLFRSISRILLAVDFVLIAPISLMVLSHRNVSIGMIPAIAVAAYTTYKVTIAIVNYTKVKKHENISLFLLKIINLKDAMVSVLTLQNTMVMVFGTDKSMQTLTAYTSAAILAFMIIITALLIRKGRKIS